MNTSDIIILATIIVYMAAMVVIGIVLSRRNSNVGDFYLGGRKLGPLVTAMSAEASDMSSYLLMGLPGLAYLTGGAEVGWTAIGLAIGTYLNWLIVAKRLRVYSHKCGAITIPDFFSNRYKDDKKVLLGISALIILIFFVPYTASGFSACGKLFNSLFGWNYHTAMLISAVIIIAYTCTGGFLAASTTDLIQSIVMTLALVSILIFGVSNAGGLGNVIDNAKSIPGYFSLASIHNVETGGADKYSILTIASLLAWGLGYFGMPHILLRFMAVEDKQKLKTSRRIASIWVVISMAIAIFIGFIGNALTKKGEFAALSGADSERVIIKIAQYMSDHHTALAVIGRSCICRNSRLHNVNLRLAASCSLVSGFGEHSQKRSQDQNGRKEVHVHSAYRTRYHRSSRRYHRLGSEQLYFPRSFVRVGRLWRNIRPCYPHRSFLEALQQIRRNSRYDSRRSYGIPLEVRYCQAWRSIRYL